MKILFVALDFKPLTGGVAEYTHQIALHLHKLGEKVFVLSKQFSDSEQFDKNCPYKVYRENFDYLLLKNRLLKWTEGYKVFKKYKKKISPDVIICNTFFSDALRMGIFSKLHRRAFVIFTHGLEINACRMSFKEKLTRKLTFELADRIFCVSTYTQKLLGFYKINLNKTTVIPGGINLEEFRPPDQRVFSKIVKKYTLNNKKVLLTVGRLVERKGHDMVIRALPEIKKVFPDIIYIIAGEGPYKPVLKELVKKYSLKNNVIFTGRVNEYEKIALYHICDIFIMPCRELKNGSVEGFGIVFAEANACEKPVIGGKSGGVVDAIKHGETGLLVNPNNVKEIAESVIYLLTHPDIARKMGKRGRKRVEEELNWNILINKVIKELKSISKN